MTKKDVTVIKKSGEHEPFSYKKYRESLERADVPEKHIERVINDIQPHLKDPIKTTDLYEKTYEILKKYEPACAGRYSLKEALRKLGPSGFPFERLAERYFQAQGMDTQRSEILPGKCITHEMDVIGMKDSICCLAECKFHNDPGDRLSVHVPMYMRARWNDIHASATQWQGYELKDFSQCWLITNAKFSDQSIDYGTCQGLHLLGWKFPRESGIEAEIKKYNLYPVTTLTILTIDEAHDLIERGIVICTDIEKKKKKLHDMHFKKATLDEIIQECGKICNP